MDSKQSLTTQSLTQFSTPLRGISALLALVTMYHQKPLPFSCFLLTFLRSKALKLTFLIVFFILPFLASQASAASIKDRMRERLPTINALKDKAVIGENNKGYLQYLSSNKPEEKAITAENSDRKKVYKAIAKKQKVSINLVGQRRAQQIAKIANKGHKYQNSDGKWLTK